jgi:hypothetical protein
VVSTIEPTSIVLSAAVETKVVTVLVTPPIPASSSFYCMAMPIELTREVPCLSTDVEAPHNFPTKGLENQPPPP